MKFITILVDTVLVYFIAKISFILLSGKESMALLDAAPAGVVLIYAFGYFSIMEINRHAAAIYRTLVGSFVVLAMVIHATTINFFLDGEVAWKTIALIIAAATLLSTQVITKKVAELAI